MVQPMYGFVVAPGDCLRLDGDLQAGRGVDYEHGLVVNIRVLALWDGLVAVRVVQMSVIGPLAAFGGLRSEAAKGEVRAYLEELGARYEQVACAEGIVVAEIEEVESV